MLSVPDRKDVGNNAWAVAHKDVDAGFLPTNYAKNGILAANNQKAWELVYQNTVAKNIVMTLDYENVTDKVTDADTATGFVRFALFY